MRLTSLKTLCLLLLLAALAVDIAANRFSPEQASQLLPASLGDFRAGSSASPFEPETSAKVEPFLVVSAASRMYQSKNGESFSAALVVTRSESSAYALLMSIGCPGGPSEETARLEELGSKQCVFPPKVVFARGPVFVAIETKKGSAVSPETLQSFARVLAPTLDEGEGDIPVLVKHLPGWPNIQKEIFYAVSPATLKAAVMNQPVLNEVSFAGGAEAVVAHYGTQKLVLVEFNTASLATDNDRRITAKLQELRSQGQPAPTAYRRVGNYAVFVFDAPDEQTANQLIDQVKYQQVVQWLGENPYSYEQATREFTETTLGVFVSVVKASGLALLATLMVGGLFGTLLFRVRRAQQRNREAYADSDAMLRLNLDDLTPETDPARLLGRGQ